MLNYGVDFYDILCLSTLFGFLFVCFLMPKNTFCYYFYLLLRFQPSRLGERYRSMNSRYFHIQ